MKHETEDERWAYNAEDCVRTLECARVEQGIVKQLHLDEVEAVQQAMLWPILKAMLRGVKIDTKARDEMAMELLEEMHKREQFFVHVLGHPLNPRSPMQMQKLFYEDMQFKPILKRGTGRPTLDDDALTKLSLKEPAIAPLIEMIAQYRTLGIYLATFVKAPLDADGRMRCSFNPCGTETYRLSSSENAFGSGTNLQTIPGGDA